MNGRQQWMEVCADPACPDYGVRESGLHELAALLQRESARLKPREEMPRCVDMAPHTELPVPPDMARQGIVRVVVWPCLDPDCPEPGDDDGGLKIHALCLGREYRSEDRGPVKRDDGRVAVRDAARQPRRMTRRQRRSGRRPGRL